MTAAPVRVFETSYEGGWYDKGQRSPGYRHFPSLAEGQIWAAGQATFFAWHEPVPATFTGRALEEIRSVAAEGKRARVWAMPAGLPGAEAPPLPAPPRSPDRPPRCIKTHFEIRCVKDGKPTPLPDQADTLNDAREAAAYKCKALGYDNYFELDPGESFTDATADGLYLVTVKTEFVAQPL